jgi:hypothetical protein
VEIWPASPIIYKIKFNPVMSPKEKLFLFIIFTYIYDNFFFCFVCRLRGAGACFWSLAIYIYIYTNYLGFQGFFSKLL